MKKNKMMRAASGLLVATLLTTSIISGTFAKYVTSAEGTDTARVARWGFTDTSIKFDDLFKTTYDQNVTGEADVIAPGTTNSATFKFDYTEGQKAPEVAYKFKVDTEGSSCADDIQNNKNIVWSLDGTEYKTDAESTSWNKMIAAIKKLSGSENGEETYAAGTLPTGFEKDNSHTVTWKWEFNTDDAADKEDTKLGDKAVLDNVTLKITVSATQID